MRPSLNHTTAFHPKQRTVLGFSLTRAFAGIAIVALAASLFFPAFQVQRAAAKRAFQNTFAAEAFPASVESRGIGSTPGTTADEDSGVEEASD